MEQLTIDWALADRLAGNNHEQAKEILALLLELLPTHQQEIVTTYQQKNWPALLQALHKLIGALCYCGTPRLKKAIENLHQSIKKQTTQKSLRDKYFQASLYEINELSKTLHQYAEKNQTNCPAQYPDDQAHCKL